MSRSREIKVHTLSEPETEFDKAEPFFSFFKHSLVSDISDNV